MNRTRYCLALILTMAISFLTSVSVFASEMDDRIESSAEQSYVYRTYLNDDDIQIASKNGIVTLTGTVSEETHKSLAKETVSSLPGVTRVDNKLAIKGENPAEYSDAWLVTKVKSSLLFHRNVSATATEVFSKNGTVTLRGQADNKAQKDLTAEYALDVEGVKTVKNEMTVLTAAVPRDKKTTGEKIGTMMTSGKNTVSETVEAFGESIDDASITAMVKTTLLYHRSTSALNTTVETNEGVVMLGGKAKNTSERDLATKLVSDVHGVTNVINTMTIQ